ncbi:Uncharacterised protein [Pasteurella multocida subsp. septica]|nr:Uncharacterised protein [Pasteurella multocida subsp. septica]
MPQIKVNYRIGSLEMINKDLQQIRIVNCRIGSLENLAYQVKATGSVHCHVSSFN